MIDIIVCFKDHSEATIFADVYSFYETRKQLKIMQEELYKSTTTMINKDYICYYKVVETV